MHQWCFHREKPPPRRMGGCLLGVCCSRAPLGAAGGPRALEEPRWCQPCPATARSSPKQGILRTLTLSSTICPSDSQTQFLGGSGALPYAEGYQTNLRCDFKRLKKNSHFQPGFFQFNFHQSSKRNWGRRLALLHFQMDFASFI